MEHIIQHLQENTDHDNEYYITEDQDDDNNFFEPHDRYDDNNSNCTYIVNTILSNIARLNVHLPIATILVFTNFAPFLTNSGKCTTLDRWLMGGFTGFLAASCVFVSITDSFRTATGGLYYGVATFHGIWKFGGGRARPCVLSDYKLRWGDLFYASLSLIVFLVFVLVQNDVLSCYDVVLPRKFINLAPLVIGFVVSLLFVLFPSSRRGIGHPFLLHTDGLHTRC
ncbi:hypothetical protein PHJA_000276200 [Phtheirospermum japonicum]|uniref:Uncharacterized protein n=1 Tax=Phtheirospermum japonicum TaxID=374723 RepID=A0A830B7T3_9LAMI|nr:hypothetical protein PHJA_000276200 [Phtheirospermum japonicum]